MGVGGQHHAPAALPAESPGTHRIGDWVDPRAGLDWCGKSRPPAEFEPPTAHSTKQGLDKMWIGACYKTRRMALWESRIKYK